MLRAPSLLLLALAVAMPAAAVADTKAEKAAKKKKAKKDKKKSKADKEQEKADLEAAEAEAEAAAEAENATSDADALKTKEKVDAEAEAEAAKAEAEAEAAKAEAEAAKPDESEKVAVKPPEDAAAPSTGVRLTLPRGRLVIGGSTANINLSADAVAKPISLAPSIWYGISDKLSIGVTHDGGTTTWTPRPGVKSTTINVGGGVLDTTVSGAGICVTGTDGNCRKVYDNVGADVLFGIADGNFSAAAHVGFDVLRFDPLTLAARLGVLGAFKASSKIAIVFDPRVQVGVTERGSNGESLDVPLWVWFNASPKLGVYVHTGIAGPFDGLADAFSVPVGLGASIHAGERLTLGADFHFSNLLGKGSSVDGRVLGVRLAFML